MGLIAEAEHLTTRESGRKRSGACTEMGIETRRIYARLFTEIKRNVWHVDRHRCVGETNAKFDLLTSCVRKDQQPHFDSRLPRVCVAFTALFAGPPLILSVLLTMKGWRMQCTPAKQVRF